jgi:hypothetical protein
LSVSTRGLEGRLRRAERVALAHATARIEEIFRRMSDAELASFVWASAHRRLAEGPVEERAVDEVFLIRPGDAAEVIGESAVLGLARWEALGGPEVFRALSGMTGPAPEYFEVMDAAGRRAREPLEALDASLASGDRVLPRLGIA